MQKARDKSDCLWHSEANTNVFQCFLNVRQSWNMVKYLK